MLDVLVGCDEDITKFLRAKCVLSAAKLTNEIITEDRTVQPQSTNAGPTQSILALKNRYSAHGLR